MKRRKMKKSNFCEQDDEGSDGGDVETLVFGDIESTFWTRKTTASRKYTEENPLLLPFVSISWLEVSLLLHRNTDGNINTRCSVVSKFTWRHSSTFVSFSSSSFASFSFSCLCGFGNWTKLREAKTLFAVLSRFDVHDDRVLASVCLQGNSSMLDMTMMWCEPTLNKSVAKRAMCRGKATSDGSNGYGTMTLCTYKTKKTFTKWTSTMAAKRNAETKKKNEWRASERMKTENYWWWIANGNHCNDDAAADDDDNDGTSCSGVINGMRNTIKI